MSSPLAIHLFETFRAERDHVPLSGLHLREGERLLAYFALRNGEPVAARELAKLFWPAEAAIRPGSEGDFPCVRQALSALRQALGADAHRITRPTRATVRFDVTSIECDVLAFDALTQVAAGESSGIEGSEAARPVGAAWLEAASLYRGPLLTAWDDAWVKEARIRRQRAYERILRRLIEYARLRGEWTEVDRWTRRLVAARPTDEEAGRDLLRLLSASGRHAEAGEMLDGLADAARVAGQALEPETLALAGELRQARVRISLPAGVITPPVAVTAPAAAPPQNTTSAPIACTPNQENSVALPSFNSAAAQEFATLPIEPAGGAVPVQSPFYIAREEDAEFHAALARGDSIVVIKGARQVGKTSLMARGLHRARQAGMRVVVTDFQKINAEQLVSANTLYLALAESLAMQLDLDVLPGEDWNLAFGPNMNLERYLRRRVLRAFPEPLVWCLDEVDRLFTCSFGQEVFGLFRSWHNERALDPSCPWSRVSLALACATEVSLFITDINLSPFNVGTRLTLEDFTPAQVAELSRRYGGVLSEEECARLHILTGGHPYLTRRGLDVMWQGMSLERMEREGHHADGPFGEHLRRLSASLSPDLLELVREMLAGRPCSDPKAFYRLRTGGILTGASCGEARWRCRLYAAFLSSQFAPSPPIA